MAVAGAWILIVVSIVAYCLGFDNAADHHHGMETPSNYHSRRNSMHSSSGDSCYSSESDSRPSSPNHYAGLDDSFPVDLMFESLTPEEPPVVETKKKKKKKKKPAFFE